MQSYGNYGNIMFANKRQYRRHEDSYSDDYVSENHNFTESSEFEEEELTEEEDEQLNLSDSSEFSNGND